MANGEKVRTVTDFISLGSKITGDCRHERKRCLLLSRKAMTNLDTVSKTSFCQQRSVYSKLCFFSSHVWMWELDHKEGWAAKNWCFRIVVLETSESPVDCKEIKPVYPKGNQHWIFIGRTNAEAPILWPPNVKNQLPENFPDVGKDWWQEDGMTEDEMVRWLHQLKDMSLSKL